MIGPPASEMSSLPDPYHQHPHRGRTGVPQLWCIPRKLLCWEGYPQPGKQIRIVSKICRIGAIQWCFNWQDPKILWQTSNLLDESCFNSLQEPLFKRLLVVLGKSKWLHNPVYSLVEQKCPQTWRTVLSQILHITQNEFSLCCGMPSNRGIHLFVRFVRRLPRKSSNSPVWTM